MSDKETKDNNKETGEKPEDDKSVEATQPQQEDLYEDVSFIRHDEELEFYKAPLIKKDHLLVILGSGIALILLCTFAIFSTLSFTDRINPIKIHDKKTSDIGIYDPSITYDPNRNLLWMAYSSIHRRTDGQPPEININLASSRNKGITWKYNETIFSSKKDSLIKTNGDASNEGIWRYETPTILYDPDDPQKAWKVYAYKYFWTGSTKEARKYSVITLKTSSNKNNGNWSNEEWLFSAKQGQPPAPYGNLVLLHLNGLHPSLTDMLYYAEPGVIYYDKSILMTLTAYKDDDKPDRIILIGSKDHGQSWLFMGTLLTSKDAEHYGSYTRVDSSALAEDQEKLYLMVSFGDEKIKHQGTHVFAFEDYIQGRLETDKSGLPTIINYISPPFPEAMTPLGAGQSAYNEELTGGVYMPQMLSNNPIQPFAIYPTKTKLIGN